MAGLAQIEFNVYATALETALIATAEPGYQRANYATNHKYNNALFRRALEDFKQSWETWIQTAATNTSQSAQNQVQDTIKTIPAKF